MRLRTKILVITFCIILFIQGINCVLEIGFLFNNFEKKSINKYIIIGTEIKRSLDKSLLFGKPLTHINYDRLISNMVPDDVRNLLIADNTKKIVYAFKQNTKSRMFPFYTEFSQVKTKENYQVFIPLTNKSDEVLGNIIFIIPNKKIVMKLSDLIRKSLINFAIIIVVTIPILFVILTIFINGPYFRFMGRLERDLKEERYDSLKASQVDLSPLIAAEETIREVREGKWLISNNRELVESIETDVSPTSRNNDMMKKFMRILTTN